MLLPEQPERRPHALPLGDLDARLEATVLLRELAGRVQTRRRVLAGAVPARVVRRALGRRGDDERSVGDDRVRRAARVVLELVVAPAAAAGVEAPLARVGARAVGPVELVGPRERPAGLCRASAGAPGTAAARADRTTGLAAGSPAGGLAGVSLTLVGRRPAARLAEIAVARAGVAPQVHPRTRVARGAARARSSGAGARSPASRARCYADHAGVPPLRVGLVAVVELHDGAVCRVVGLRRRGTCCCSCSRSRRNRSPRPA